MPSRRDPQDSHAVDAVACSQVGVYIVCTPNLAVHASVGGDRSMHHHVIFAKSCMS